MSASIISRDWAEAELSPEDSFFGSVSGGKHLLEPLKGWPAFAATFKVMFVEEYRENLDFAKKRRIVMFPLMVALVTMVATIGLQFLVGEGAAQGADSISDSKTFSWNEMRLALHIAQVIRCSIPMPTMRSRSTEVCSILRKQEETSIRMQNSWSLIGNMNCSVVRLNSRHNVTSLLSRVKALLNLSRLVMISGFNVNRQKPSLTSG